MGVLNTSQRERFVHEGVVVFDAGLPATLIEGIRKDLQGRYQRVYNGGGVLEPTRLQDAWHVSRNAHRLATWPRILTALAELYGRAPRPFQTLNFPTGTIQPAHADAVHFNSAPAGFMAGVWVALEDVDETSGPLFYYPGSHRTPEFDMADVGVESSEERYDRYELFVEEVVRTFGFKKRLATLKRGEVLIWASNLIHGGEARRDAARSRHSQVTHYFFEGCRYFTPLESRGLDIAWREPDFLPMEIPRRPWLKRVVRKLRTHFDKDVPVG